MNHSQFIQQAVEIGSNNVTSNNGGPFGAVIVKNGEIIASSGNCVTINKDPTAHAEIMAIRQACTILNDFQLIDCILYSSCEPCPMCLGAIYWARVKKVYFACNRQDAAKAGFDDSFIYDEILLDVEQRHIPMQQLELASADQPFIDWNIQNKKILY